VALKTRLPSAPSPEAGAASLSSYIFHGLKQYAPGFALEVALFWVTLLGFQAWVSPIRGSWVSLLLVGFPIVVAAMGSGELAFRLYRRVWTVAGLPDAFAIGAAVLEATCIVAVVNAAVPIWIRPYSVLTPLFAAPAVGAVIALFRLYPSLILPRRGPNRLVVVAPGPGSFAAVKALIQHRNPGWSPVAVVTTETSAIGKTVMGIPVIGRVDHLQHWLSVVRADGVAFVANHDRNDDLQAPLRICLAAELPMFMVSGPEEWLNGGNGGLRQVSADELLGRAPHSVDVEPSRPFLRDRTILVTGAAGSIGSELCRCLASLGPRRLILVENDESRLFDIVEELHASSSVEVREALLSIVDGERLSALFVRERPDIIFHAAAYKHVPMLESHPLQAVLTNVIGTSNVLRAAEAAAVDKLVLISTDKAVAGHSVMGCSKRICEMLISSYPGPMSVWGVRFGNVVGSRGSVVPLFERQIAEGGPVTITHPDASRYMMTIREAASLTIATLGLARSNQLFMLEMGQPVSILRLAQALIRSKGLRPGIDIEIVFTGLRPGEVVAEELLASDELSLFTTNPSIREVRSPRAVDHEAVAQTVEHLRRLIAEGRSDALVAALRRAVASAETKTIKETASAVRS
jgi:FlaA1/EpsC-like NDP-sugar epimerase